MILEKSVACFLKEVNMADEQQKVEVEKEVTAVTKNFTTIPNSNSEFCIYTYKAETESYTQLMRPGFFDTAFSFLNTGDTIRTFRFDDQKNLTHYLEHIVVVVDKINRTVKTALINQCNLTKR